MDDTIVFATGNARKIAEANATLGEYGLVVEPTKIEADEIQHHDPAEITKAKARAAYAVVKRPVVVSDTSWAIPALNGFPGGYMKDVSIWWQADDWLSIMARHDDKRIICMEHLAYYDGETLQHFVEEYEGHFTTEARGRIDEAEAFERVAVMYGDKTMAEQLEEGSHASAGEEHGHWQQFAKWYTSR
jgi:non-canonical purine NTP pyrophosphatase (RdgB/HAM1 family)